jgi:undecaprenyl-diphosphatase
MGMSVLMAILLGFIQGVTVFMPISYSGHQAILQNLIHLEMPERGLGVFDLLMNISAVVSILMAYRRELVAMLEEGAAFLQGKAPENPTSEGRLSPQVRVIYFIIIATLPLILSAPISSRIDMLLKNTIFVGAAMIAMGFMLFATDRFMKFGKKNEKSMSVKDALIIGLAQAFSVIPGLSRVGTAVCVGLSRGLGKDFAVRFAIFLSLPSVIISILVSFFAAFKTGMDWTSFFSYLLGFVVSIVTGYLSLQMLRLLTRRRRLRYFSYYLWLAGVLTIVFSLIF